MDKELLETQINCEALEEDYQNIKNHRRFLGRFVPEVEILNSERVVLADGDVPIYVANHISHLDHFVPHYAIIDSGLPFPRSIASAHLNSGMFRRIFNFEGKGVIWHDRENHSLGYIRGYRNRIFEVINTGVPVFFHPEGSRNRNPENGLKEFKDAAFKMFFSIQNEMREKECDKNLVFVCIGLKYQNYPERGFYDKIGNHAEDFRYKFWETYCMARWMTRGNKGIARVNFWKPIYLSGIAGTKSREKGENATRIIRERIISLLEEIT